MSNLRIRPIKKITPIKPRKRMTMIQIIPDESESPKAKTRIIPIPIIIGFPKIKLPKITKPAQIKIKKPIKPIKPPKPPTGQVLGGPVQSSVASAVWYWSDTSVMIIDFHGGAQYEYYHTTFDLFNYIYNGLGTATTDGHNQYGRWWKGKSNPSIGASIRQRLSKGMADYKRVK